jgi:putative DNA primase/helicase
MDGFTPTPEMERDRSADALEIARLALLDPIDYDRERAAAAERLGCRTSTLDEQVKAARPQPDKATGRSVDLPVVEPWPERVKAADLLDAVTAAIRRHVILPPSTATCVSLWIAHSWVYERFQHTPRLSVTSPVKRCGKSTLLDLLRALSCRPLKADSISPSGVFRTVEALAPLTLLIDEADTFLADNEELRGIMNSGFEASGQVIRVVEVKDEWQPIRFATFAPVALAGIGTLPGTLEDRALPVVLQRKGAAEMVQRLRANGAREALHDLARQLARWAQDRRAYLSPDPDMPAALGDREADVSVPLVAIADDAGGEWPARARKALLDVFGLRTKEDGNTEAGTLLLSDIKAVFLGAGTDRLRSEHLADALGAMEERPWSEWKNGKPISKPQLARLLRPFGVHPGTIRVPGNETPKGYYRDAFKMAWDRYLPPPPAGTATSDRHTATSAQNQGFVAGAEPPHPEKRGGYEKGSVSQKSDSCGGVAVFTGEVGGEEGVAGWSEPL